MSSWIRGCGPAPSPCLAWLSGANLSPSIHSSLTDKELGPWLPGASPAYHSPKGV